MKKAAYLLIVLLTIPFACAHLDAGEDVISGDALIDFGYSPSEITVGKNIFFAVNVRNATTEAPIPADRVWVRIATGDEVVFSGSLAIDIINSASWSYQFLRPGAYDVHVRFERGDATLAEHDFKIGAHQSVFAEKPTSWFMILALYVSLTVFILTGIHVYKKVKSNDSQKKEGKKTTKK